MYTVEGGMDKQTNYSEISINLPPKSLSRDFLFQLVRLVFFMVYDLEF